MARLIWSIGVSLDSSIASRRAVRLGGAGLAAEFARRDLIDAAVSPAQGALTLCLRR
jgi:hypothetical protein